MLAAFIFQEKIVKMAGIMFMVLGLMNLIGNIIATAWIEFGQFLIMSLMAFSFIVMGFLFFKYRRELSRYAETARGHARLKYFPWILTAIVILLMPLMIAFIIAQCWVCMKYMLVFEIVIPITFFVWWISMRNVIQRDRSPEELGFTEVPTHEPQGIDEEGPTTQFEIEELQSQQTPTQFEIESQEESQSQQTSKDEGD